MVTAVSRTFESGSRLSLTARAVLLALILFCEKFALNFLVDFDAAVTATGFGAVVRAAQHAGFRFAVAFAVSLGLFAYARGDRGWRDLNEAARGSSISMPGLALHVLLVLPLAPLSYYLYGPRGAPLALPLLVALWLMFALAAVVVLFRALAPWELWRRGAATLGALWLYAAVAAGLAASALQWSQSLWRPTAAFTFDVVYHVLAPFIPSLSADPSTLILHSSRFAVEVSDECSGLEGAGLLMTFCGAWLLCFRREYFFPRALIVLPIGLVLSFALNIARIATLMAIGYAGYPQMAIYGFHSQAGWIAFNCVAGAIAFASRRSRWLSRTARDAATHGAGASVGAGAGAGVVADASARAMGSGGGPADTVRSENPTAAYLLPFLLILAAGMLARAVSNGFETLYGLRLIAAAGAIVWGWPRLRRLDWRCSWRGPLVGAVIFFGWIGVAALVTHPQSMPEALVSMRPAARITWLAVRVAAAVITVPVAEELAFRGYLLRRIAAADFEAVRFARVGATALLLSSVVFGLEHERALWVPGVLAGLLYGALVMRTERIGEAVAAHGTTNALLAAYVLIGGQWQLW